MSPHTRIGADPRALARQLQALSTPARVDHWPGNVLIAAWGPEAGSASLVVTPTSLVLKIPNRHIVASGILPFQDAIRPGAEIVADILRRILAALERPRPLRASRPGPDVRRALAALAVVAGTHYAAARARTPLHGARLEPDHVATHPATREIASHLLSLIAPRGWFLSGSAESVEINPGAYFGWPSPPAPNAHARARAHEILAAFLAPR